MAISINRKPQHTGGDGYTSRANASTSPMHYGFKSTVSPVNNVDAKHDIENFFSSNSALVVEVSNADAANYKPLDYIEITESSDENLNGLRLKILSINSGSGWLYLDYAVSSTSATGGKIQIVRRNYRGIVRIHDGDTDEVISEREVIFTGDNQGYLDVKRAAVRELDLDTRTKGVYISHAESYTIVNNDGFLETYISEFTVDTTPTYIKQLQEVDFNTVVEWSNEAFGVDYQLPWTLAGDGKAVCTASSTPDRSQLLVQDMPNRTASSLSVSTRHIINVRCIGFDTASPTSRVRARLHAWNDSTDTWDFIDAASTAITSGDHTVEFSIVNLNNVGALTNNHDKLGYSIEPADYDGSNVSWTAEINSIYIAAQTSNENEEFENGLNGWTTTQQLGLTADWVIVDGKPTWDGSYNSGVVQNEISYWIGQEGNVLPREGDPVTVSLDFDILRLTGGETVGISIQLVHDDNSIETMAGVSGFGAIGNHQFTTTHTRTTNKRLVQIRVLFSLDSGLLSEGDVVEVRLNSFKTGNGIGAGNVYSSVFGAMQFQNEAGGNFISHVCRDSGTVVPNLTHLPFHRYYTGKEIMMNNLVDNNDFFGRSIDEFTYEFKVYNGATELHDGEIKKPRGNSYYEIVSTEIMTEIKALYDVDLVSWTHIEVEFGYTTNRLIPIAEVFTIRNFGDPCEDGTTLKWLNDLGGVEITYFDHKKMISEVIKDRKNTTLPTYLTLDGLRDGTTQKLNYYNSSYDVHTINSKHLTDEEYEQLQKIKNSIIVQMLMPNGKYQTGTLKDRSFVKVDRDLNEKEISFKIEMSDNLNQSI